MKKFASNISVALLLVVYLAAFAGFKIHECTDDHTVELLSVLADDTCEQVHHHHCADEEHCGHHHHHSHHPLSEEPEGLQIAESDCCHNSVHALFSEQITDGDDMQQGLFTASHSVEQPVFQAPAVAFGRAQAVSAAALRPSGRTMLVLYSVARA